MYISSNLKSAELDIFVNFCLALLIADSHNPSKWGAYGRMKGYWIPFMKHKILYPFVSAQLDQFFEIFISTFKSSIIWNNLTWTASSRDKSCCKGNCSKARTNWRNATSQVVCRCSPDSSQKAIGNWRERHIRIESDAKGHADAIYRALNATSWLLFVFKDGPNFD